MGNGCAKQSHIANLTPISNISQLARDFFQSSNYCLHGDEEEPQHKLGETANQGVMVL